jgi:hypothetical protein
MLLSSAVCLRHIALDTIIVFKKKHHTLLRRWKVKWKTKAIKIKRRRLMGKYWSLVWELNIVREKKQLSQYSDYPTGWTSEKQWFYIRHLDRIRSLPSPLAHIPTALSRGPKRLGRETDHSLSALKLRMSGPTTLLPPYVFTACTETTVPYLPWVTEIINWYSVSCYVLGEYRTKLIFRPLWFAYWALLVLSVPQKHRQCLRKVHKRYVVERYDNLRGHSTAHPRPDNSLGRSSSRYDLSSLSRLSGVQFPL